MSQIRNTAYKTVGEEANEEGDLQSFLSLHDTRLVVHTTGRSGPHRHAE